MVIIQITGLSSNFHLIRNKNLCKEWLRINCARLVVQSLHKLLGSHFNNTHWEAPYLVHDALRSVQSDMFHYREKYPLYVESWFVAQHTGRHITVHFFLHHFWNKEIVKKFTSVLATGKYRKVVLATPQYMSQKCFISSYCKDACWELELGCLVISKFMLDLKILTIRKYSSTPVMATRCH